MTQEEVDNLKAGDTVFLFEFPTDPLMLKGTFEEKSTDGKYLYIKLGWGYTVIRRPDEVYLKDLRREN